MLFSCSSRRNFGLSLLLLHLTLIPYHTSAKARLSEHYTLRCEWGGDFLFAPPLPFVVVMCGCFCFYCHATLMFSFLGIVVLT